MSRQSKRISKARNLSTQAKERSAANLLGALLVSPGGRKMKLSTESFRVNLRAEHVILFLEQILRRTAGPIVLVWDNHPIPRRRLVQNFLQSEPGLDVYSFPICAPELNSMEFVWTYVSRATENVAPQNLAALNTKIHSFLGRVYLNSNPRS